MLRHQANISSQTKDTLVEQVKAYQEEVVELKSKIKVCLRKKKKIFLEKLDVLDKYWINFSILTLDIWNCGSQLLKVVYFIKSVFYLVFQYLST